MLYCDVRVCWFIMNKSMEMEMDIKNVFARVWRQVTLCDLILLLLLQYTAVLPVGAHVVSTDGGSGISTKHNVQPYEQFLTSKS